MGVVNGIISDAQENDLILSKDNNKVINYFRMTDSYWFLVFNIKPELDFKQDCHSSYTTSGCCSRRLV